MMEPNPSFIPFKSVLWTWLVVESQSDRGLADAHAGKGSSGFIQLVVDCWREPLMKMALEKWDRHFVEAVLIEFADPRRIAFPEADRFEDLLQKWNDGLFSPEPE